MDTEQDVHCLGCCSTCSQETIAGSLPNGGNLEWAQTVGARGGCQCATPPPHILSLSRVGLPFRCHYPYASQHLLRRCAPQCSKQLRLQIPAPPGRQYSPVPRISTSHPSLPLSHQPTQPLAWSLRLRLSLLLLGSMVVLLPFAFSVSLLPLGSMVGVKDVVASGLDSGACVWGPSAAPAAQTLIMAARRTNCGKGYQS